MWKQTTLQEASKILCKCKKTKVKSCILRAGLDENLLCQRNREKSIKTYYYYVGVWEEDVNDCGMFCRMRQHFKTRYLVSAVFINALNSTTEHSINTY